MSPIENALDAVDFRYILLDQYKKLGMNENDLAVVLMTEQLLRSGNSFVTPDLLSLKMTLKTSEIDDIVSSLIKRGFLAYETEGKNGMRTSLAPLKEKLYEAFQRNLAKQNSSLMSAERAEILASLYAYFEKRLNRPLSPIENDQIKTWLDDAYSDEEIRYALEDTLAHGKRTMKAVDKTLRSGRARNDISKEGYTTVSENWNQDIERTIEIAKARWVTDDDDGEE